MSLVACVNALVGSRHLTVSDIMNLVRISRDVWHDRAHSYYVLSSVYFPLMHSAMTTSLGSVCHSDARDIAVGGSCVALAPFYRKQLIVCGATSLLSAIASDTSRLVVAAGGAMCVFTHDNMSSLTRAVQSRLVSEQTTMYTQPPHRINVVTCSGNGDGRVYFAHGYSVRGNGQLYPKQSVGVMQLVSTKSDQVYWQISYLSEQFRRLPGDYECSIINKYDFLVIPITNQHSTNTIRLVDCAYCRDVLLRYQFFIQTRVGSAATTVSETDDQSNTAPLPVSHREFYLEHNSVYGIRSSGHRIFCVGSTLVLVYFDLETKRLRIYAADVDAFVFEEVVCSGSAPVFEVSDGTSEFSPRLCHTINDYIAVVHGATRRIHMLHVCRHGGGYSFHWRAMHSVDFNRSTSVLVGCYAHGMNLSVLEYNVAAGANLKRHVFTIAPGMDSAVVYDTKMMDTGAVGWLSNVMQANGLRSAFMDPRIRLRRRVVVADDGDVQICNSLEVLVPPLGLIYSEPDASDYRTILTATDALCCRFDNVDQCLPLNDRRNVKLCLTKTCGSADLSLWFVLCNDGVASGADGDQFLHMYFRLCN